MEANKPDGMAKNPSLLHRLKEAAWKLKIETYALYLACRDRRTPWYAKALALFVVAHTFSPIDLIPDFIPVLGYLDDLIITPLGIWLALKMIPPEVMAEARQQAAKNMSVDHKLGRWGAVIIISTWLVALAAVGYLVYRFVRRN
jgi:uncharacterized membrane protein YkvA (DUF1232 family)